MYKFTDGRIAFSEQERDNYIKAGYRLIEEKIEEEPNEDRQDEEKTNNLRTIKKKFGRSK